MPKRLSAAVPLTAVALVLTAFAVPWWETASHLFQGGRTDPSDTVQTALVVLTAAVAVAYFGGVRWRDLERLGNAWSVTTCVGRRAMPNDRLRASAGWGVTTLFAERYWGRGLNAVAATLRWLTPVLAAGSLLAALACLAVAAARALAADLTAGLAAQPGWIDALGLALPALLWPAVGMHLRPVAHEAVPTDAQINEAYLDLLGRLTEPRLQAGAAAMGAVDTGLDGVFALARRMSAMLPPAAPAAHDLAGLSEIPRQLVGAESDHQG